MSYCILRPDSKLYDKIFDHTNNRENSLFLYEYFISKDFIKENNDSLEFENNEPTYESISKFININNASTDEAKIKVFTKELNSNNSLLPITEVVEKVVKFNESHPSYIATVINFNRNSNDIVVQATDSESAKKKTDLENALKIYKVINKYLSDLGIPITIIDANIMKYEEGLIRPDRLYNTIDDIYGVINIANTESGLRSIPEEFCHFVIENIKSDPIIQRTLSQITPEMTQFILGDEYEQVVSYYDSKGRPDLIKREVLGRMYATLLKGEEIKTNIPYKNLLQRGLEKLKAFIYKTLGVASPTTLSFQLNEIVKTLTPYTNIENIKNIITPETLKQFKLMGDSLAHAKERVDLLQSATGSALDNLAQHINVYRDKEKSSTFDENEIEIYKNLHKAYFSGKYFEGLLNYVYESVTLMNTINGNIAKISKEINESANPNRITLLHNAHMLKEIKNFIDSYSEPIELISTLLNQLQNGNYKLPTDVYISPEDLQFLSTEVGVIKSLLFNLEDSYKLLGKQTLVHFYKEFFSEKGESTRKDRQNNQIDLITVLEESDSDISLLDRWLQSAASSTDAFVGLIDRAIQDKQQDIRQRTQIIEHKIIQMDRKFKADGGGSTSFIYEKDKDGLPTGYIANELFSRASFNEAMKAYREKEIPETDSESGKESKMSEWYYKNTIEYEYVKESKNSKLETVLNTRIHRIPNPAIYPSTTKFTKVQKEYLDSYLEIKKELDFFLPSKKGVPFVAVQKLIENATEAVLNNKVKGMNVTKNLLETTTNLFKITDNDEAEYQGTSKYKFKLNLKKNRKDVVSKVLTNFDKTIHYQVPIYYTSIINNKNMLSQDASSALVDYAIMATNYSGMHEIVDFMEITKDIAKLRTINRTDNGQVAKTTFTVDGVEFSKNAVLPAAEVTQRINSLIETQVYGQARYKGSTVLGVDTNKALDALIKYTSWSMLGFNFFTGINNVLVGKTQMFIEANGKEFFTMKDWLAGDLEYTKNLPALMSELNTPINTSRLGLIGEMFNVGLHWKESSKERNYYKGDLTTTLQHFNASFLMTAGEHHMQMSTAIAFLKHFKVLENGKEISLYDSLETETIKHNGKKIDGKIFIRDGVTNLDGSKITTKQIRDISLQIGKINQQMHGIYNSEDSMEAKRTAVGRLATMYRNYLVPTFNKRMRGAFGTEVPYDYYFHNYREGYYVTTANFIKDIFRKGNRSITSTIALWNALSETADGHRKQANLRRTLFEFVNMGIIFVLTLLLVNLGGDGDEPDDVWFNRMAYYFLKRNLLESRLYIAPWDTFETILISPTAVLAPIQNYMKLLKSLATFWSDDMGGHVLESGLYKDHTTLYRDMVKALPIYNSVYDFFTIHESDKRFKIFEE